MFRPQKAAQMTTPCILQKNYTYTQDGFSQKRYDDIGNPFLCNFSAYGSTEVEKNGLLVVEENITVTTWYNPEILAGCRIKRLTDGAIFDIIGQPENVEMRNMFTVCNVLRVRGGT